MLVKDLLPTFAIVAAIIWLMRLLGTGYFGWSLFQLSLWVIVLLVIARFAWELLEWWTEIITVTDQGLTIRDHPILKNETLLPLPRIADIEFHRTLVGWPLGYGTLTVTSNGGDAKTRKYVPREVYNELINLESDFANW
jgi:uncharacterized membrane protein YdbT with pleckstrin-like domain